MGVELVRVYFRFIIPVNGLGEILNSDEVSGEGIPVAGNWKGEDRSLTQLE
jgi:hypothetical protein